MELKDFISNTIEQISQGIIDATKRCSSYGVIVNPRVTIGNGDNFSIPKYPEHVNIVRRVQLLKMDVAVTAEESHESAAGAGLKISILGLNFGAQDGSSKANENRVRFSIPVCFPTSPIEESIPEGKTLATNRNAIEY